MANVHYLPDDIAIVGWSCRLPGAKSVDDLWALLKAGRCSVTTVPNDRFALDRFGHPRKQERGRSYTWAAGVLDNVWEFDPGVFGISPREAVQMDPQQRLLLQLTWEALEDAGIKPSAIAGTETGVYVGASQIDYAHPFVTDYAVADSHFATGTALAILANRISYIFDLRGPSVTIDTACSSSLVALHQAAEELRAGRIETAVVGGVNVITSPSSFIAFSQASMLSPTGLCHSFSAEADGFVRAEGAGVFVLRRLSRAQKERNPVHGIVVASGVNSDGRTGGISLPSLDAQASLLKRVYSQANIDPRRLAFVEAHGTGTAAGDPIEATALGRELGVARPDDEPLLIGSIKSNIGHLEPGAGVAGVLKALLSLNHGELPPTVHFTKPNPNIPFDNLNLKVCDRTTPLPAASEMLAGVNSFGFGGTNAHVVLAAGRPSGEAKDVAPAAPKMLAISAETAPALSAMAENYRTLVGRLDAIAMEKVASAAAHRRDHLATRVTVLGKSGADVADALSAFIAGRDDPRVVHGEAVGEDMPVAFVFSGNGSQWPGMGIAAFQSSDAFRDHFLKLDGYFRPLSGWSLRERLFAKDIADKLSATSIAQPLIFAIQSAMTVALKARGLKPVAVLGHSVGEIAAAEAAGILSPEQAIRLVYFRSKHQERVRGTGRMLAVRATEPVLADMLRAYPEVEIAAHNSPTGFTIAGPAQQLAALTGAYPKIPTVDLELDYPFHTSLLAPIENELIADLADLTPSEGHTVFVSTVTGDEIAARDVDGKYWWQNIRMPVRFGDAVRAAASRGARYFVEIGPRPTLGKHITDNLAGEVDGVAVASAADRYDDKVPAFDRLIAHALVTGANIDIAAVFGPDPGAAVRLPAYPWQQKNYRLQHTSEAIDTELDAPPLIGMRHSPDALEWHSNIDTALWPEFRDHRVGDQILFPGTAFVEIALSVAGQWLKSPKVTLTNFEILKALDLSRDETREIMTRVSPGPSMIEIFSRPRLSQAPWVRHCRAKFLHGAEFNDDLLPALRDRAVVATLKSGEVYSIADAAGLHYGPAFRRVTQMALHKGDVIDVALELGERESRFILDPVRADCSSHGFLAVIPELRAAERGVAYIPVRIDSATVYRPHISPFRATVEVTGKSDRAIVFNYFMIDDRDRVIAQFRGVHCQAVAVRRLVPVESVAMTEGLEPLDGALFDKTGLDIAPSDLMRALTGAVAPSVNAGGVDHRAMTDALAVTAGYQVARALAEDRLVDPNHLVLAGKVPTALQGWLANILSHLEAAGLATERFGAWLLAADEDMPDLASLVAEYAAAFPDRSAELLLAGAVSGFVKQIALDRAVPVSSDTILSASVQDFYSSTSLFAAAGGERLRAALSQLTEFWPRRRMQRVLMLGHGPFAHWLASQAKSNPIDVTILEGDAWTRDRAQAALGIHPHVRVVDTDFGLTEAGFDLIVSVGGLHRLPAEIDVATLAKVLAPGGVAIALEPPPSLFSDIAFGLQPNWFAAVPGARAKSKLRRADGWSEQFKSAGFANIAADSLDIAGDSSAVIIAQMPAAGMAASVPRASASYGERREPLLVALAVPKSAAPKSTARKPAVANDEDSRQLDALVRAMRLNREAVTNLSDITAKDGDTVIVLPPRERSTEPADALAQRCLALKTVAEKLSSAKVKLWLLFREALDGAATTLQPVERGAWAFSRTLANEFANLDIRRVNLAAGVAPETAADRLLRVIGSDSPETEIRIAGDSVEAVRVNALTIGQFTSQPDTGAARLDRQGGTGHGLSWQAVPRTRPGPGEIEIAVEATGLNFRDLMWSLSMLPDDMLENGYTGPTLGLECAGRVVRVGPGVQDIEPGSRVVALAASAFSTYVTVPASRVAQIPRGITVEGAATIPVAFLTAYYSLIRLAQLETGDTVLIHGGAGGVGLAAIQIAQWRGAKIIASAGSPAKRHLLNALGIEHVLDSRSTNFVEDILAITGEGVDVVLNSLAGEAMEMGIACLKPFGRFIELGKRDYVSNTHIGLRPFRRNLSYFGVDLDQLVVGRAGIGKVVFDEVMHLFATGELRELPYCVFDGENVAEAFHLMQQSGHIGKIVVRPPMAGVARPASKSWAVSATGTHVITGAFGGFGREAARWLADRGARHIVLTGRRGVATERDKALVAELTRRGVNVVAEACDVAQPESVQRLFQRIQTTLPPVVGVMHAAMVLDDTVITNLTPARFNAVAAPKVKGLENLDYATRGLALDYFVMFSSMTVMFGNPGQGNYVAANAYMDALARRRRARGLPALSVGWGPITDVGVVAESERLKANLEHLTGLSGMRAREALDYMAQVLAQDTGAPEQAAVTIVANSGGFSKNRLPVFASPTYRNFVSGRSEVAHEAERLDIAAALASEKPELVRRRVVDAVAGQLAKVLHARAEDISSIRPLGEIGLDSLMALELVMNLERTFGMNIAFAGSVGALTVPAVADEIIAQVGRGQTREEATLADIAERHVTAIDAGAVETLKDKVTSALREGRKT